jgi:lactoylglutathione lyase
MTLNHLNLTVTSPEETSAFLVRYFDLLPRGGNQGMQFLNDDRGMVLTLIKARADDRVAGAPGEGEADPTATTHVRYPSSFHIGFIQESEDRVNQINERLRNDGFHVPPPSRQHGAWTFYFTAPGGFTIEVMS